MARKKSKPPTFNKISILIYIFLIFIGLGLGFVLSQNRVPDISVSENITIKNAVNGKDYKLTQTSLAPVVKLDGIDGNAIVDIPGGKIKVNVSLKNLILPQNSDLQAYLIDAGINGGPGKASNSEDDEKYGRFYNNLSYKRNIDLAPFVQPLGTLVKEGEYYTLSFDLPNSNFYSYDAIVVTLESFNPANPQRDPRPGPVILSSNLN